MSGASARTSKHRQRLLTAAFILIPVSSVGYYSVQRWLSSLEARYPPVDTTTTTTTVLRTPCNPATQRCAYIDTYAARVPLRILLQRQQQYQQARGRREEEANNDKENLHITWAKAFFGSRIMRAETPFIGLPSASDEIDRSIKFVSASDEVYQHGSLAFVTDQQISLVTTSINTKKKDKHERQYPAEWQPAEGVLFCWHMPTRPRKFFESLARWGYPWRLMSGGRHELRVSRPFIPDNNQDELEPEPMVEVRFATAHDYEVVPAEGPLEKQKIIPAWTLRLHRAYARLLLDRAVRELIASSETG
ncbi:hypothetical protein VTN77DRAFT_2252 [Rasamsonia byssochlamydoides]|uniref:uncharacterized protein n=1 Tax=Rasamsonia byssochlamydoides TaxID=89139 RepID=UPI003742957E